jgi:hypothetical protein
MKPKEWPKTEVFHPCDSSLFLAIQVVLDVYEAIKGRFVSSIYFLFTVLFLFHLLCCSLLLYYLLHLYLFRPVLSFLLIPSLRHSSSSFPLLFFTHFPFPLYFLPISPSLILHLRLSFPFPILPFLPFFLLPLQCPVQSSYPFKV